VKLLNLNTELFKI